jgi:uncharacterized delta-60 repeat protein
VGSIFDNGNDEDVDVGVVRFNAAGGVDASFVTIPFEFGPESTQTTFGQAGALDSTGEVVAAGGSGISPELFGLARLNSDGTLDSSFGNGGKLTTRFHGTEAISAVTIQPDGKIVAVGETLNSQTGIANLALARYVAQ